ncbi:MAG: hypothetical protein N4A41_11050 [Crocinitomicaceae bacterium]|jgi:hypothetical protein|nr:hypothetical protein [Crocinitomicaceae bacterium]
MKKTTILFCVLTLLIGIGSCKKNTETIKPFSAYVYDPQSKQAHSGIELGIFESQVFNGQITTIGKPVFRAKTDVNGKFSLDKKIKSNNTLLIASLDTSYLFVGKEYAQAYRILAPKEIKKNNIIELEMAPKGGLKINIQHFCTGDYYTKGTLNIQSKDYSFVYKKELVITSCGFSSMHFEDLAHGEYTMILNKEKEGESAHQLYSFTIDKGKTTTVNVTF